MYSVPKSLRIAILLNPFDFKVKGGEYAPQLARELLGKGHTVRGFGAPGGLIPRSGKDPDEDGQRRSNSGLGVVSFKPDVILAYDALSPAAFMGARAARTLKVPLILVEAGTSIGGRFYERFLRWCGERMWGSFVRRYAKILIALDSVAEAQARSEGFDESVIRVLPQGVDLNEFRPGLTSNLLARHRIGGRVLLYIGLVSADRGLEVLINAYAKTLGQGSDWSLVIAGDGLPSARQALRALVDRLGMGSVVRCLPSLRAEEIPGLMGSATLLVVPAVNDGVRGIQIPRAMACGLPVLASDLPRFSDLLENEQSGMLVDAGSIPAWTDALRKAGGAPEARRRWGVRGRELAEERLAWPLIADSVEKLLEQVVQARALEEDEEARKERSPRASA
ncbi:MAG: glycosyltransferase involved in cell wall biosynthesis [Candidatus Paceibacteria bacterium]